MSPTKVKTVTLDPAVWNRGYEYGESSLLAVVDGQRFQCCVGVACTALGLSDDAIMGACYPHDDSLKNRRLPAPIRALVRVRQSAEEMPMAIYDINDDTGPTYGSDAVRVKAINADLVKHKIPLRFRLKKARAK